MEIAIGDNMWSELLGKIDEQKKVVGENHRNLVNVAKENKFFESILGDYEKYRDYMVRDKKKQFESLLYIHEYLDKLINKSTVLNLETRRLTDDQGDILDKLARVRRELNEFSEYDIIPQGLLPN